MTELMSQCRPPSIGRAGSGINSIIDDYRRATNLSPNSNGIYESVESLFINTHAKHIFDNIFYRKTHDIRSMKTLSDRIRELVALQIRILFRNLTMYSQSRALHGKLGVVPPFDTTDDLKKFLNGLNWHARRQGHPGSDREFRLLVKPNIGDFNSLL